MEDIKLKIKRNRESDHLSFVAHINRYHHLKEFLYELHNTLFLVAVALRDITNEGSLC